MCVSTSDAQRMHMSFVQRGCMTIDQETDETVWGAPQSSPQRWGMRETLTAVGVAAVIAGLGGAAIYAATGSQSSQTFGRGMPGGPPPAGFSSQQLTAALPALHGELVVSDGKGGYSTMLTQTGTITAISPTSITVRSTDNFTQTYDLRPATGISHSLVVNDEVTLQATRTGQVATATTVNERIGPGGPDGPPGPAPQN